ncbi:MAG: peptidylprolyl isomerase [Amphiplicatus sp.]|nr:peptidylprolyl isomerase [Amphiplicatus sp.]
MSAATAIFFGVEIPESLLARELQNHQAGALSQARAMAGRSLAARAVLLARSRELELEPVPERNSDGQEETTEEALIRAVLSEEVDVEPPTAEEVRTVYDAKPDGFMSPPLIEASHILVAPADSVERALSEARMKAEELIHRLRSDPAAFGRMAANHSACPSGAEGGALGQLRPGDVLDDIWTALSGLEVGEIGTEPVLSEHGWHVLRLDHRSTGERLPFDYVRPHIAMQLEARAWTTAAARYVDGLLSRSSAAPGLALGADGRLDSGDGCLSRADDLLGSALSDADAAYAALGSDARARIDAAALREGETPARILALAIRTFLSKADDEAWTQLISKLRDSDAPLSDSMGLIVAHEYSPLHRTYTLIRMRNGAEATT